ARGTAYVGGAHIVEAFQYFDAETVGRAVSVWSLGLWGVFLLVGMVVVFFYSLDALYGDRKDRSVLFWKSLPVTDTQTVVSKLLTALIVAPVIGIVAVLGTTILSMIVASIAAMFQGVNPFGLLWTEVPFFRIVLSMVSLGLGMSIWFLPFVAWLFFASAASTRTPFLIALLVPAGVAFAEKVAFNTSVFLETISNYAGGFFENFGERMAEFGIRHNGGNFDDFVVNGDLPGPMDVVSALLDPALLVGLVIAAALLFLTIRMRHQRIDIG
ncbi:MAG: hypothetical protein AAF610_01505, partial [Pseudomonadota bacterium]